MEASYETSELQYPQYGLFYLREKSMRYPPYFPSTPCQEVVPTHRDASENHSRPLALPSTPPILGSDVVIPLSCVSLHSHPRDIALITSPLTSGPDLDNQTSSTVALR